jgi:hypothetical protein
VLKRLAYSEAVFGIASRNHGPEQLVWKSDERFYLSVRGTIGNPQVEVEESTSHRMSVA